MSVISKKLRRLFYVAAFTVATSPTIFAEDLIPLTKDSSKADSAQVPIDPETKRPAALNDPYSTTSFEQFKVETQRASQGLEGFNQIEIEVENINPKTGNLPANGMTRTAVKVRALDADGKILKKKLVAKITAPGVRIAPSYENEKLVDSIGKRLGKEEIELNDGEATFYIISPQSATDTLLTVKIGQEEVKGKLVFAPDIRPLIAAGIVEGVINLGRNTSNIVAPSAGMSDGFEKELKHWQRTFDNGKIKINARTTFFIKGAIKGEYLLTAMYDSEKDTRQRNFKDINPDKYYPVMGDSAQRGYEAKSSEKLYVRVDNGKNYALFGDFSTGSNFSQSLGGNNVAPIQQRNLGQYNRTMTGVRLYRDDGVGNLDTFAMRESLRQAIEEYRGNGTSGPYSVANNNAVENTEKIEVVVRDRNNVSRILSVTSLTRFVDYTFEPFTGRILLKSALPSLDPDLNPISLRITYEVDTGGAKYWVYGAAGQRKITDKIEIGGSFMRDENPETPVGTSYSTTPGIGIRDLRELESANVGIQLNEQNKIVFEMASTSSSTTDQDIRGNAARIEWAGRGGYNNNAGENLKWDGRFFIGDSGKNFHNPSSSFTDGRVEIGGKGFIELTPKTRLVGSLSYTEDKWLNTKRDGEAISIEHQYNPKIILDAGVRHVYQSEGAVFSSLNSSINNIPGQGSIYDKSGNLNSNGAGFWGMGTGIDPSTGQPQNTLTGQALKAPYTNAAIDAYTVRGGARYLVQENWWVGSELGQDIGVGNDPTWLALNTDYRYSKGRFFGRVETPTGRGSAGGDYKVTDDATLYGRWEHSNGLASNYNLDSSAKSEAIIFGVRNADGKGSENFTELRMLDGFNRRDIENASGSRNTFTINENLKASTNAERLEILKGNSRSAFALGGGLEWIDTLWQANTKLEWRHLDRDSTSTTDNATDSWLNTITLARKINNSWTGLAKNYLLTTNDQSLPGFQIQNRFQMGAAYRPIERNDFDMLFRYENKYEKNSQVNPEEDRFANVVSTNANWHPEGSIWLNGRLAAKTVSESLAGVQSDYQAGLVSGRIIKDLNKDFDVGLQGSMMYSPQGNTKQYALGAEVGYLMQQNTWVSAGYNFTGFSDRDLTGSDYTARGTYVRLRMKFDEKNLVPVFKKMQLQDN